MAIPKINPNHVRRVPKRSIRNNFSNSVRHKIYERDQGLCRNCGGLGGEIHHCKFKSAGGRGVFTNGILLCHECHRKTHDNKKLADRWRYICERDYGPDYFRDEYDL